MKSQHRRGDMVWCHHIRGKRMKGQILSFHKDNSMTIQVFLPLSKDERKKFYQQYLLLKPHQISKIED